MPEEQSLPPRAGALITSMRDIGYDLETAIADILDNSISAGADRIDILSVERGGEQVIAIVDNGHGMSKGELREALTLGVADANRQRADGELGMFGLGLKTASFSQCRKLTVISSEGGKRCGAEWDLDVVQQRDNWVISILNEDDMDRVPFSEKLPDYPNPGTLVVWRELDRLADGKSGLDRNSIINRKLDQVCDHISLVFHRFLSGKTWGKQIAVTVNGRAIKAFDPFCRSNTATQTLPREIVRLDGKEVSIQPYILPHYSKLSEMESRRYQSISEFRANQGVYVYRSGRLMTWGGWLRLMPASEKTKLARVQIDFPNSLDKDWGIDIKKSQARPPHAVREQLQQIIQKIESRSVAVYREQGIKLVDKISHPLWQRHPKRGGVDYRINREHPVTRALSKSYAKGLEVVLGALELSLPLDAIYMDMADNSGDNHPAEMQEGAQWQKLLDLKEYLADTGCDDEKNFRDIAHSIGFCKGNPETLENFIQVTWHERRK